MSDTHAAEAAEHIETVDPALEVEARDYGWTPKDDFKGDPAKWRPATDYLDWAKSTGRLPKSQFDEFKRLFPAIRQENQSLKSELNEIKQTLNQFVEFSSKSEERAFNRARQELEARVQQAAANADPEAARVAMQELANLKPEPKVEAKKPEPASDTKIDPVIQDWIGKNDWFTKNQTLSAFATETYGELEREKPGLSQEERLAETKRQTMLKFPEKFGINPNREGAAAVASPGSGGAPRKKGKSYDDLPADAKRACDKFVKTIPGYTKEQYVKDYDWDN